MPETYEVIACIVPKPCEARVIEWLEEIEDYISTEAYSPVSESAAC
jgi:hypothetical protein